MEREVRKKTVEEEDLLNRSTKKAKGVQIEEIQMDETMGERKYNEENLGSSKEADGDEENMNPNVVESEARKDDEARDLAAKGIMEKENKEEARKILSYKDKLLGFNEGDHDEEELEEDSACLVVNVSSEERKELCKPWKLSLIVKLLGHEMGMRSLKAKLQKSWSLYGPCKFIDMENDYFLVRFFYIKYYNFV